jgi:hypothetical protein
MTAVSIFALPKDINNLPAVVIEHSYSDRLACMDRIVRSHRVFFMLNEDVGNYWQCISKVALAMLTIVLYNIDLSIVAFHDPAMVMNFRFFIIGKLWNVSRFMLSDIVFLNVSIIKFLASGNV